MRTFLAKLFARLAGRRRFKAMPPALTGLASPAGFLDVVRRRREPTAFELLAELKNTAWTCASINASVCANFPPRLFVRTRGSEPLPRCLTRPLGAKVLHRLRSASHLDSYTRGAERLEEVLDHPLLALLAHANPQHNAFDPWTNSLLTCILCVESTIHGGYETCESEK